MTPMFFGNSKSPLFGVYHPPTGVKLLNKAILICSPIAQEHIRSYKSIRLLAKALSMKGYHVLRFDYSGVGDSSSSLKDVSMSNWLNDISIAHDELADISGLKKISLIGVRVGGALVMMSDKYKMAEKIILWDPVLIGHRYLFDLNEMHSNMLSDLLRFKCKRENVSEENELLGFVYNKLLLKEIEGININFSNDNLESPFCYFSSNNYDFLSLKKYNNVSVINDAGDWGDLDKVEDILFCNQLSNKILSDF